MSSSYYTSYHIHIFISYIIAYNNHIIHHMMHQALWLIIYHNENIITFSGFEFVKFFQQLGSKANKSKHRNSNTIDSSGDIDDMGNSAKADGGSSSSSSSSSSSIHPYQHIVDNHFNAVQYVHIPLEKGTYNDESLSIHLFVYYINY